MANPIVALHSSTVPLKYVKSFGKFLLGEGEKKKTQGWVGETYYASIRVWFFGTRVPLNKLVSPLSPVRV